jgi:hypothetical protein
MVSFNLKGEIRDGGKRIRLMSTGTGEDAALRFDIVVGTPNVYGRQLATHSGFSVGDRVRLENCYTRYKDFALGQEGVIRDIRMFSFALYYVELADEDAEISKLVTKVHRKDRGMAEGQLRHHVSCQWWHLKTAEGGEGGAGGAGGGAK